MSLIVSLFVALTVSVMPAKDTVTLNNGKAAYIGEVPAGEGKLYHEEQGLFIGHFNRMVLSGRGIQIKPDGSLYCGNFVRSAYQGYGRLFMATGTILCGEFSGGRANGRDTLYYPNGKVFIGVVQNNGATSQGKTYKSAAAAGVTKPERPFVQLDEYDEAFLARIGNGEYDTPAIYGDGASFFQAYIHPNFRYTEAMERKTAIVHYEFTVGEDGKLRDIHILSSTDEAFSKELMRVLQKCPKWKPAMKDGKAVPFAVKNQRINFTASE